MWAFGGGDYDYLGKDWEFWYSKSPHDERAVAVQKCLRYILILENSSNTVLLFDVGKER